MTLQDVLHEKLKIQNILRILLLRYDGFRDPTIRRHFEKLSVVEDLKIYINRSVRPDFMKFESCTAFV